MISIRKIAKKYGVSVRPLKSLVASIPDLPVYQRGDQWFTTDEDEFLEALEHAGFVLSEDLPPEEDEDEEDGDEDDDED